MAIMPNQERVIQDVERILKCRGRRGHGLQYLVKWQGQPFDRRTEARSSKGHLNYVGTSTTTTQTHLGSLRVTLEGGNVTANSRPRGTGGSSVMWSRCLA